jgi:hypothetical protein
MTSPQPLPEERSWTQWGYVTAAEAERFEEWERQSLEVCACTHLRREHFTDARGCVHVARSRSSAGVSRLECGCGGFTYPVAAPGVTETAEHGSRDHRTAETGETTP